MSRGIRLTPQGALLEGEIFLPAAEVPPGPARHRADRVRLPGRRRPARGHHRHAPGPGAPGGLAEDESTVNNAGAFLDWGLPKDLLLPWDEVVFEQKQKLAAGRRVLVAVFQAEDGRLAASPG